MILFIILILVIVGLIFYNIMKKNDKKLNILTIFIILNIIVMLGLQTLPYVHDINLVGIVILVLTNIVILLLSNKLSKNKISLIISILVYLIIMFATPVYKFKDHEHIFDHNNVMNMTMSDGTVKEFPTETIREYIMYYDIYNIRLYKSM